MGLFDTKAKKAAAPVKAAAKKSSGLFKSSAKAKSDDDDDVDYESSGSSGVRATSGWGGAKRLKQETSTWSTPVKLESGDTVVLRFLDDEPYANIAMHWVERTGRKSFICIGKGCPLCARGERPRPYNYFNVIQLTDGEPLALTLEAKARVFAQIEALAKDPKSSPLSKFYYTYKRTGAKKDNTVYTLERIRRASDIEEEFPELHVPTEAEVKKAKRYTLDDALAGKLSRDKMEEIGKEMDGGIPDDDD